MSRVKAEQSIIANQLELAKVFDSLNDMFIVVNPKLEIISVNSTALEYLGLTKETLKGKMIGDIYSIKKSESDNLLSRALSGTVIHLDSKVKGKDGKLIHVETRVAAGKRNDEDLLYFVSRLTSAQ